MNSVLIWLLAILAAGFWFLGTRRRTPFRLIAGVVLAVILFSPLALLPIMLCFDPQKYLL